MHLAVIELALRDVPSSKQIPPDLGRILSPNSAKKNLLTKREHRPFCKLIQSTLTLCMKQEVSAFDRRKKSFQGKHNEKSEKK